MAIPKSTSQPSLRVTRTLDFPRERVWRAWTKAEALKRWMAPADGFRTEVPEHDCRVGGRYVIVMIAADGKVNRVEGRFVEVNAPERLVFTWVWEGGEREETLVTIELSDRDGKTDLVLTHQRFASEDVRDSHNKGWAGCLDRLARLA